MAEEHDSTREASGPLDGSLISARAMRETFRREYSQQHRAMTLVTFGGFLLLTMFVLCVGYLVYYLITQGEQIQFFVQNSLNEAYTAGTPESAYVALLLPFMPLLIISLLGVLSGLLGIGLLKSVGLGRAPVIPDADRDILTPLLRGTDGVEQYIKLSGLSGATGLFTKLGLHGLPLATLSLTVFLCLLGALSPPFFDLAKLTLGAFLGSYVQRGQDLQMSWVNTFLGRGSETRRSERDEAATPPAI